MKRLVTLFAATLAIALSVLPAAAQSETVVAGAGEGIFPSGAVLYGVPLNGLQFAKGITIDASGSATGQFQTLLLGTSLLGQPQNINVEGKASSGTVTARRDGRANVKTIARILPDRSAPPDPSRAVPIHLQGRYGPRNASSSRTKVAGSSRTRWW